MTTNQTRVPDEELDQMIWKLERDGMTPKQLSLMRELREVRSAKGEPVAWTWKYLEQWHVTNDEGRARDLAWDGVKVVPLYTAMPAPVVPTNVADAIERLKQRLADCHRFNYCAEAVREVEDACRAAMLQAGNSRGTPDEQSFWNWLREEMPTTYRWSRELEDTPENSALITKGKASALDMLIAWKGCSDAMFQLSGNSEQLEPVSNRDELKKGLAAIRNSGIAIDGEKILAERDVLNSPATTDGWIPVRERMPENMDTVITSNGFDIGHGWWDGDTWQEWSYHDAVPGDVTHWMPIPKPPKDDL